MEHPFPFMEAIIMRTLYTIILSLMFFAGSACSISDSESNTQTPQKPNVPRVHVDPPPHHGPTQFTECDLSDADRVQQLWYTGDNLTNASFDNPNDFVPHNFIPSNNLLHARTMNLAFAPTPGLLVQGSSFHYAETGGWAFQGPFTGRFGLDDQWQVRVSIEELYKVRLRWLVTDEIFMEVDPSPAPENASDQHPRINAIITPGAERLITVTCYNGPTLVTSYELPSGKQGPTTLIESNFSCDWGNKGVTLIPTPDAEGVLLSGTRGGVLFHVDLVEGDYTRVQAVGDISEFGLGNTIWHNLIYDIAVHPSGEWAMSSNSNGLIRFWGLPELVEIREPLETAIEGVNENTYMPFNVSPLAISHDGDLMAHVTPEGEVVIRNTDTFEREVTLERPENSEVDTGQVNHLLNNSVITFAFEKNSSALAVLYAAGPALYGCVDWTIEGESHNLEVLLDGPSKAKVGEKVEFVATHIGTDHVHGHQFLVNNVVMTDLSMERAFTWTPKRAGIFEITVVLDDGFNLGETTVLLTVE
jgi:hypothetical protein